MGDGIIKGIYRSSAPTNTNNQAGEIEVDINSNLKVADQFSPQAEDNVNGVIAIVSKPLAVSTYALSNAVGLGAATKANVKASAGIVYAISATNVNAAVRYLLLHNKATAPVATDVPLQAWLIPVNSTIIVQVPAAGIYCSTGIGWAISTTLATFTDAATAAEHAVNIHYK